MELSGWPGQEAHGHYFHGHADSCSRHDHDFHSQLQSTWPWLSMPHGQLQLTCRITFTVSVPHGQLQLTLPLLLCGNQCPLCWEPRADKCSPVKAWSRSEYSHACFACFQFFFPCSIFYLPCSPFKAWIRSEYSHSCFATARNFFLVLIDDLRKSRGLHSVRAFGHGPVYIYRSMPAGVAHSRHAFVGGTASTWGRWWIPVNKRHQKCWSNTHCSQGTCRSDSRFPQLVVQCKL